MRRIAILALAFVLVAVDAPAEASVPGLSGPDLARLASIARPLEPPALAPPVVPLPEPIDAILGDGEPGPDCGGSADAGEAWDDAMPVALPVACAGALGAADDLDLFVADVPSTHHLRALVVAPQGATFAACLATPDRVLVACRYGGDVALVTNATGGWTVVVARVSGEGAYDLRVDATPVPAEGEDCAGAPGANEPADAATILVPASCEGSTRFLDDIYDWYRFDAEAAKVSGSASAPTLACFFRADDLVHPTSCAELGADEAYIHAPGGGALLLVYAPHDASYHLDLAFDVAQDDCASGLDAPGNVYLGTPIAGAPCGGSLTSADAADVYVVHVPEGLAMAVAGAFDPGVDAMVCVLALPTAPFEPTNCEIAWAGGSGIAETGAPAGPARDVLVAAVATGATSYALSFDLHAPRAQDDCGAGADAPSDPSQAPPRALALACDGELVARDGDVWDVFRIELTEGPVYADLFALLDADLCLVDAAFAEGACSSRGELDVWWPSGPAYVVVVRTGGSGSYHLRVEQQDDCGTGADALWSGAEVAAPLVRCEATLDVFTGDSEDAFLVPPPLVPDVVVVRMEPAAPRMRLCIEDEVQALGVRGRCTDSTFSRILVAREPLRPIRVTVAGFATDPFGYTLIVEDPVAHPPQVPPLL